MKKELKKGKLKVTPRPLIANIFASDPNAMIATMPDDKFKKGWIDEEPPCEWENFIINLIFKALLFTQNSGSGQKWNTDVPYDKDAIVTGSDGKVYLSNIDGNKGHDPITDKTNWRSDSTGLPDHDHGAPGRGANIPESSVTNLVTDLANKAPMSHVSDTTNPHKTTAAQVGSYTTSETDTKLETKIDKSNISDSENDNVHDKVASTILTYALKLLINARAIAPVSHQKMIPKFREKGGNHQMDDGYDVGYGQNDIAVLTDQIGSDWVFPLRVMPRFYIGKSWPIEIKTEADKEWWKLFVKPEYSLVAKGDIAAIIDKILKNWTLTGNCVIDKTEHAPDQDPWSFKYDVTAIGKASAKIDIPNDPMACQVFLARWLKGDNLTGKIDLNVKIHFKDGTTEDKQLPHSGSGTFAWKRDELTIDLTTTSKAITHIEISCDSTAGAGTGWIDNLDIRFNLGNKTNPLWSDDYAPNIGPTDLFDYFICLDEAKAKQGLKDAWRDFELPVGIQWLNNHHGSTVNIVTGDMQEGKGLGPITNLWFTSQRVRDVDDVKDTKTKADKLIGEVETKTTGLLDRMTTAEGKVTTLESAVASLKTTQNFINAIIMLILPRWYAEIPYKKGIRIVDEQKAYESLIDNNLNKKPKSSTESWKLIYDGTIQTETPKCSKKKSK